MYDNYTDSLLNCSMFYDVVFHDMHSKCEIYCIVLKVIKCFSPDFVSWNRSLKGNILLSKFDWSSKAVELPAPPSPMEPLNHRLIRPKQLYILNDFF